MNSDRQHPEQGGDPPNAPSERAKAVQTVDATRRDDPSRLHVNATSGASTWG